MSAISPLIDTLLHHVLGRRGELERHASVPRGPLVVGEASRVHEQPVDGEPPRAGPVAPSGAGARSAAAGAASTEAQSDARTSAGDRQSPAGERESFSREALTIAQVLGKFPQPASIMLLSGIPQADAAAMSTATSTSPFPSPAQTPAAVGAGETPRPTPLLDAAVIAGALQSNLVGSGLFYERHLAQALLDKWPLAKLAEEPQARKTAESTAPLDDELTTIVRHQLELLSGEPLRLQFPFHPGLVADLVVRLAEEGRGEGAEESADEREAVSPTPGWQTRISVELPSLGRVDASIVRYPEGLRIELQSASGAACAALAEGSWMLEQELAGQGLAITAFDVANRRASA